MNTWVPWCMHGGCFVGINSFLLFSVGFGNQAWRRASLLPPLPSWLFSWLPLICHMWQNFFKICHLWCMLLCWNYLFSVVGRFLGAALALGTTSRPNSDEQKRRAFPISFWKTGNSFWTPSWEMRLHVSVIRTLQHGNARPITIKEWACLIRTCCVWDLRLWC